MHIMYVMLLNFCLRVVMYVLRGGCSDQLEELRQLQIQSEEEAQTLRQVAEEAGTDGSEWRYGAPVVGESLLLTVHSRIVLECRAMDGPRAGLAPRDLRDKAAPLTSRKTERTEQCVDEETPLEHHVGDGIVVIIY